MPFNFPVLVLVGDWYLGLALLLAGKLHFGCAAVLNVDSLKLTTLKPEKRH